MDKNFLEIEMSKIYLWHTQSLWVFCHHTFELERKKNSVGEVSRLLISIHDILVELQAQKFTSLEVSNLIEEKRREGLGAGCDEFCVEVNCFYENCIEYPKKWMLQV